MQTALVIFCFLYLARYSEAAAVTFDWNFSSGVKGINEWKKTYKHCAGAHQSPINIDTKEAFYDPYLKPFQLKLTNAQSAYTITNKGLNFEITFGSSIWKATFPGTNYCYQLGQIHFHWGSTNSKGAEHTINGKVYPIEVHFVMWNCDYYSTFSAAAGGISGLAVIGFFYEIDDSATPNPTLNALVDELKKPSIMQCPCTTASDYATLSIPFFNITKLMPEHKSNFFRYRGSLTTPPCTENVLWSVYEKPMKISTAQLNVFRALKNRAADNGGITNMVDNYRPPQPLNPVVPVNALRFVSYSTGLSRAVSLVPINVLGFAAVAAIITKYLE